MIQDHAREILRGLSALHGTREPLMKNFASQVRQDFSSPVAVPWKLASRRRPQQWVDTSLEADRCQLEKLKRIT
jgi:hypothetical protein